MAPSSILNRSVDRIPPPTVHTPPHLSTQSAATGAGNINNISDAFIVPRPYASNEIRAESRDDQQIATPTEAASNLGSRPKKAVRFQVYNAKDMETLRSMRHQMESRFQQMKERSNSPVTSRAELIKIAKQ